MDHGGHGHGGHAEHPCIVSMLWNTYTLDTCIVFRSWHISTYTGFVVACVALALLSVAYEYLRVLQGNLDRQIALSLARKARCDRDPPENVALVTGLSPGTYATIPTPARILRAVLYGLAVFLSFFLMLAFMTYNAYYISAIVIGAIIGHYVFGAKMNISTVLSETTSRSMACH